ncbi:MAG: inosine/xanthosine triphosphatase [Parachlamydiaceae bacterium]|nr:inosine/xanthosine triphosphatase [Parachlamydiaceae bacterium]
MKEGLGLIVAIGSTNKIKIQALEEILKNYPTFGNAKVISLQVPSEISDQPLSLNETVTGAKNRAKNVFEKCNGCQYGIGIESGLMMVSGAKTGFMEAAICCIYDGQEFFLGQSCAFELPKQIVNLVINEKLDLGQACYKSGFTSNQSLGTSEGAIGLLTNGRITRKDYTKQAITTALIQIENAHLYNVLID